jgi:hypothetical protein
MEIPVLCPPLLSWSIINYHNLSDLCDGRRCNHQAGKSGKHLENCYNAMLSSNAISRIGWRDRILRKTSGTLDRISARKNLSVKESQRERNWTKFLGQRGFCILDEFA